MTYPHSPQPPTTRWREEVVVTQEDSPRSNTFGNSMMIFGSTILIRGCWYTNPGTGQLLMGFGGGLIALGLLLHVVSRLSDATTRTR